MEGLAKMKYVKIPGQIYDLVRLFNYHFNKSSLEKVIEDPEDYEKTHFSVLNGETIDEDLLLFFYSPDGLSGFISENFLIANSNIFSNENNIETALSSIKAPGLFGRVLSYYLKCESIDDSESLSPEQVYKLIKNIDVPDKVKLMIVLYSMNKSYFNELLINELNSKLLLVEKHYQKVRIKIEYVLRLLESEIVRTEILNALNIKTDSENIAYFSVSATENKMAAVFGEGDTRCLVIGYGTTDKLQEMLGSRAFDMFIVAKALADTLRIRIINIIKEKGEMNTTEIANAFGKGLTAVFYHLNMLAEAKILNTRNRGRTVLYSVNKDLFANLSVFSKDFAVNSATRL